MELTRIKSFHPDQMGPFFQGGNFPGKTAGPARVPAIVIAGTHQGPAGMGLAFDVGGGSIVLRVQRVELLVEPMLGRDPRIDRTADRSDGWSLHGRASVRRSIFSIPEAEEARTVPLGACDGEGDLGEAVIGLAVPGKAVSHHHHSLRLSIPFPDQNRSGIKLSSLLVKPGQAARRYRPSFLRNRSVQHQSRLA